MTVSNVANVCVLIWVPRRFGVLPFVVLAMTAYTLVALPTTLEFSAWYAHATI